RHGSGGGLLYLAASTATHDQLGLAPDTRERRVRWGPASHRGAVMSRPPGKPRRARSRMLLAWLVMATLFAIPAVLNTATPVDAAQAPRNILPASSERALHN